MKSSLYIFSSGSLQRKDNTLFFINEKGQRAIPIHAISDLMIFGELDINKRALELISQHGICVHFLNYYGYYVGSFYPREKNNAGIITLKQAEHYLNKELRLYLAKAFVYGGARNIVRNLDYYKRNKDESLEESISKIEELIKSINQKNSIAELMGLESEIRKVYYSAFNIILDNFKFERRTIRPPQNPINAMLSFGNSMLYVTVLSEIYKTHLDPRIGFLHETNQRSFSLNLDIAEVFKPVIVDRVIFTLVNKNQIQEKHFEEGLNYAYLNEKGREIFVKAFEDKLKTTIKYKNVGKISYRRSIRVECYKLYKHFLGEDTYKPFISDW